MKVDATVVADGTDWSASICIIGAGPAGLAIAATLREPLLQAGRSMVVLDRGGKTAQATDREPLLLPGEGLDAEAFANTHAWGIGGTATIWNTMIAERAWAKYVPLDSTDFAERAWVPWSGWPFSRDVLAPFYQRAHAMCATGGGQVPVPESRVGGSVNAGMYHLGPASRFVSVLPAALEEATNVQLVCGARAIGFTRSATGRITAVRWRSATGVQGTVHADQFVLAAGALENARFLLDDRDVVGGAQPDRPWLGRGFMEHPIDRCLLVRSPRRSGSIAEHLHTARELQGQGQVVGRVGFDPELLREERLPNMSLRAGGGGPAAAVAAVSVAPDTVAATARSRLRRLIPSVRLRRLIGNSVRTVLGARRRFGPSALRLFLDLEQWPQRENRVLLTGQRGTTGSALATVQWRWRPEEEAMRLRAQVVVRRELQRHGLGTVEVTPDLPLNPYAHHHAGTTRMHEDPEQGVVDANLRVHGEENLYIAGSSVFPTSGVANPTLTNVALSIRLAEQLSKHSRR